jgi:DNA-binding NtrC family response regulator
MQERQRILVVDPDPAIRSLIMAVLRHDGYLPEGADSADTALDLRRVSKHAAIVVDPRMFGGEALVEALTSHDAENVIIMTTSSGLKARYAAAPGVRGVLLKPFVVTELSEILASCCHQQQAFTAP